MKLLKTKRFMFEIVKLQGMISIIEQCNYDKTVIMEFLKKHTKTQSEYEDELDSFLEVLSFLLLEKTK